MRKSIESHPGLQPRKSGRPTKAARMDQRGLELDDVGSLGALGTLGNFEANALFLFEGTEPAILDRGVVNEKVRSAFIRSDEAETLFGVEPLDGALCHDCILLITPGMLLAMTPSRQGRHSRLVIPALNGPHTKMITKGEAIPQKTLETKAKSCKSCALASTRPP
jgi:hypothetical protein